MLAAYSAHPPAPLERRRAQERRPHIPAQPLDPHARTQIALSTPPNLCTLLLISFSRTYSLQASDLMSRSERCRRMRAARTIFCVSTAREADPGRRSGDSSPPGPPRACALPPNPPLAASRSARASQLSCEAGVRPICVLRRSVRGHTTRTRPNGSFEHPPWSKHAAASAASPHARLERVQRKKTLLLVARRRPEFRSDIGCRQAGDARHIARIP